MVVSCCAYGCKQRFSEDSNITFHRFPKDPERREKWIKALRRDNFIPTTYSRVCSKHFSEECFDRDRGTAYCARNWLKSTAIPMNVFKPKNTDQVERELNKNILWSNTVSDNVSTPHEALESDSVDAARTVPGNACVTLAVRELNNSNTVHNVPVSDITYTIKQESYPHAPSDGIPESCIAYTCAVKQEPSPHNASFEVPMDIPEYENAYTPTNEVPESPSAYTSNEVPESDNTCIAHDVPEPRNVINDGQNEDIQERRSSDADGNMSKKPLLRYVGDIRKNHTWSNEQDEKCWTIVNKHIVRQRKVIRRLRNKNRSLLKLTGQMKDMVEDMQKKLLVAEAAHTLELTLPDTVLQLISRIGKGSSRQKYSPELRRFALVLHFYSSKAYEYVRRTFKNALPHPRALKHLVSNY